MAQKKPTASTTSTSQPGPAWERAAAYGIDMSLIEDSLRRTPEQRLAAHAGALALAWQLRQAGERRATGS